MTFTIFSASRLALFAFVAGHFCNLSFAHPSFEKRGAPIVMGLAETYGAIAATTLTSTGATLITGDCGTCPGTAITGFPPGECTGITSAGGTAACNAEAACLSAYNNARGVTPTIPLPGSDLNGLTLGPGVYTFPTSAVTLTGRLTLNGALNANGQFIFLITTTFDAMAASQIELINGAQACNVYFIVGSSAAVGAAAALKGNILAYTSISVNSGASNEGTLCALNGAVTLIDNALTAQDSCTT
ncbi:hypothetical protein DL767_007816 [Monosporascus sp. MG133]|nr:hypothetical protein DL767_007816 [Monosporascus sp. MG133]